MATSQAISQMSTLAGSVNNDNCLFTIYNALISSSASQNRKVRVSTHEQFFSNNNTVINQINYVNYFGTGVDGSVTVSSSAQISSSTSPAGLNNTAFGDIVVKNYRDLTINSGIFFSPLRACRGMLIYCTGNLTVNGTISMTGKGGGVATKIASPIGVASVTDTRFDLIDATLYFNNFSSSAAGGRGIPTHWNWAPSGSAWFNNYKIRVPLSGSVAGGAGGASSGGAGGTGTAGVFCCGSGGGGGGGGNTGNAGRAGGRGTIFSGGGGGGGAAYYTGAPGTLGTGGTIGTLEAGGNGENTGGTSAGAGGGAGNPAGSGGNSFGAGSATAGTVGAGGLLIIIARGNVTVNGTISSNGSAGGNSVGAGPAPSAIQAGGGGGGSGGGRILIIYGGTYTNAGSVVANGGSGGTSTGGPAQSGAGGSGGVGAITLRKVNT